MTQRAEQPREQMRVHELKTWPHCFSAILSGHKQFELRLNDRGFQCEDILHLREWDPETQQYTGREAFRKVSFILSKFTGLTDGYVAMGLVPA